MYLRLRKGEFSNLNMNVIGLSGCMDTERGVECGVCVDSRSVEEVVAYGRLKHTLGWNKYKESELFKVDGEKHVVEIAYLVY